MSWFGDVFINSQQQCPLDLNDKMIYTSKFRFSWNLLNCRIIKNTQKNFSIMSFWRPGQPGPANPARLPKWAWWPVLASPALKRIRFKTFFGCLFFYCSIGQKVSRKSKFGSTYHFVIKIQMELVWSLNKKLKRSFRWNANLPVFITVRK